MAGTAPLLLTQTSVMHYKDYRRSWMQDQSDLLTLLQSDSGVQAKSSLKQGEQP
jgi:hypothetical protein